MEQADLVNVSSIQNITNGTATIFASVPDDTLLAYVMLILMAAIPIYIGAKKSMHLSKAWCEANGETSNGETMTQQDAYMFPLTASGALLSLYIVFKYIGPEYINILITGYFLILGVASLTQSLRPLGELAVPSAYWGKPIHLLMQQEAEKKEGDTETPPPHKHLDFKFDYLDMGLAALAALVGVWYILTQHWVANNLFALSFCVSGISALSVNTYLIGATLLGGLFFYDIFWVFGTDVMVTVAVSFKGPIKVLFPRDFLVNGFASQNHALLGLGDIVLPGVMVALLLRFDKSRSSSGSAYFTSTYIAYIAGLMLTMFVMHTFKAAQPALLYLSPACTIVPMALSVLRGETKLLLAYEDAPEEKQDEDTPKQDEAKKSD